MEEHLTPWEKHERKEPLQKAATDQFVQCINRYGPTWDMPALEARVDHTPLASPRPVSVRIFDMKGDAELREPSLALHKALEEFHKVCASVGEDWSRILITLILSPDRKTGQFQLNFTYPY